MKVTGVPRARPPRCPRADAAKADAQVSCPPRVSGHMGEPRCTSQLALAAARQTEPL